jgi:hypothetical protein
MEVNNKMRNTCKMAVFIALSIVTLGLVASASANNTNFSSYSIMKNEPSHWQINTNGMFNGKDIAAIEAKGFLVNIQIMDLFAEKILDGTGTVNFYLDPSKMPLTADLTSIVITFKDSTTPPLVIQVGPGFAFVRLR